MGALVTTLLVDYPLETSTLAGSIRSAANKWILRYKMDPNVCIVNPSVKKKLGNPDELFGLEVKTNKEVKENVVRIGFGK